MRSAYVARLRQHVAAMQFTRKILLLAAAALGEVGLHAQAPLESGSVAEAAERLRPGEFLWAPAVAPEGPVLLVVSLATQRAVIYRNGVPIGISTVSTGRPGYRTPTGIFTVLERDVEHYSSLYNNAPMPYMQRLTWGGVALHGGTLPGYPASHGCIRLPHEFARLLYGVTRLGMTVVVTDRASVPRVAPAEILLQRSTASAFARAETVWQPERARAGPISIVISARDNWLVVLRNGVVIGRAPVSISGEIWQTLAFVLSASEGSRRVWSQIGLMGQGPDPLVAADLRDRIAVAEPFRQSVVAILQPGTTVVITPDSLQQSIGAQVAPVVEAEDPAS